MDELIEFTMGIHRGNYNDSFNGFCTCGIRPKAVKARDELKELRNQLDISNQQLKLGELLNNDLQKEVDRFNEQLEEKQNILDEQLEIIRKIALTGDGSHKDKHASFYDCLSTLQLEFSERVEHAREYLKRMEE